MSTAARARVIGVIEGIAPNDESGYRFTCPQRADRSGPPLEQWPVGCFRAFDLSDPAPEEEDITEASVRYWREEILIRVRYDAPSPQDLERVARIRGRDVRDIIKALRVPSAWASTPVDATDIDQLDFTGPPTDGQVLGNGEPIGVIAMIPLRIRYWE